MPLATDSPAFRRFRSQRDEALEGILINFQRRGRDAAADAFRTILQRIESALLRDYVNPENLRATLLQEMVPFENLLVAIYNKARRISFALAYTGEAEALGQADGKPKRFEFTKQHAKEIDHEAAIAGGNISQRVRMYLARIVSKAVDRYTAGTILGKKPKAILEDVALTFPRQKVVKTTRRFTKTLREAKADPGTKADIAVGFIDDEEWQAIVNEYKREYFSNSRDPKKEIGLPEGIPADDVGGRVYAWEYEQDLTEEFVRQVRDGEVTAAKENGITDFVHIAVVDDRTDECCLWRDGLTLREIEAELRGNRQDDGCQGLIPPLHFNCRCRIAPALDTITDDVPSNAKEFDEWLNT